jgi:hypothetical protein
MRNYWNTAFGISFAMHSLVLATGALPVFNRYIILTDKKELKDIKITIKEIPKKESSKAKLVIRR